MRVEAFVASSFAKFASAFKVLNSLLLPQQTHLNESCAMAEDDLTDSLNGLVISERMNLPLPRELRDQIWGTFMGISSVESQHC